MTTRQIGSGYNHHHNLQSKETYRPILASQLTSSEGRALQKKQLQKRQEEDFKIEELFTLKNLAALLAIIGVLSLLTLLGLSSLQSKFKKDVETINNQFTDLARNQQLLMKNQIEANYSSAARIDNLQRNLPTLVTPVLTQVAGSAISQAVQQEINRPCQSNGGMCERFKRRVDVVDDELIDTSTSSALSSTNSGQDFDVNILEEEFAPHNNVLPKLIAAQSRGPRKY